MSVSSILIQHLKDNVVTKDTFPEFKEKFDPVYNFFTLQETSSCPAIYLTVISKLTYFNTIIQLMSVNFNEGMFGIVQKELVECLESVQDKEQVFEENKQKNEFIQDNFFLKGKELAVVLRCDLGYYCIYNSDQLCVFNITNEVNGYHIFGDGRFCSGNTYQSLRSVAEDGDVYSFIMLLVNILTNYDDKAHHLAKPENFKAWTKIYEQKTWTEDEYKIVEDLIEKKSKRFFENAKMSEEAKKYVEERIEAIRDELFEKVV